MISKLSGIERFTLKSYYNSVGPMTSLEALDLAYEADVIVEQMHPLDPARIRFIRERDGLFNYATLLEKAGK